MSNLAGLRGEKFIQLRILRELVPERQDHILEEQKAAAGVRVGHIGKLLRGDVQPLRHQLAVARGEVQQVDEIAVFQNIFDLRRGKQVFGVLRRSGRTPPHFLKRFQTSALYAAVCSSFKSR